MGEVAIVNYAFSPSTLTVPTGTTVRWVNMDGDAHTVTFDDRGHGMAGMDSGRMGHMGTFSVTLTQPGTYAYRCTLHPSMTGTIIVTP
jgi:plastocyanin